MSDKQYNNIQIADNIYFFEDINGVVINGHELVLKGQEYKLLLCLVRARGRVVSQENILRTIWGPEYDVYHYSSYIKDALKRLRKQLNDSDRRIILTVKNTGYKLGMYVELDSEETKAFKLPIILSRRTVPSVGDDTIILRDNEVAFITDYLRNKKNRKILLHGFGGVGKTSLARLVYETIKDQYVSTGWIDYHIDLKNSIVEAIDFINTLSGNDDSSNNVEAKWLSISNLMKNSKEKKLVIIDNVDVDNEIGQNPLADANLTDITGWTNTDIIMTSRQPVIKGYHSIQINNLGDAKNRKNCIALFYHYYGDSNSPNDVIVGKIVELAGFNTMVIELLAKSCIYESSIEEYYEKLKTIGFAYPSVSVITMHDSTVYFLDKDCCLYYCHYSMLINISLCFALLSVPL